MNGKQKEVMSLMKEFSYDELNDLIPEFNRLFREKGRIRQSVAAEQFRIGQIVEWDSRRERRVIRMQIERINARTLSGREVDSKGNIIKSVPGWKVAPTLVRPSSVKSR